MFTGLVLDVASVIDARAVGQTLRLVLVTRLPRERFDLGASVACNGVCLTVVERHDVPATGETLLEFDAGPETLAQSQLGALKKGDRVNLEPALRVGDSVGGHDVLGHVDGVGHVRSMALWDGGFWRLEIETNLSCEKLLIAKGSIAVRGTSLTLAEVGRAPSAFSESCEEVAVFVIMIVPHTLEHTNLGNLSKGAPVELEFDRNVKTIASLLALMLPTMISR